RECGRGPLLGSHKSGKGPLSRRPGVEGLTGLHVGFRVCPHRIQARCPATCARSPWTLHTRVSVRGLVRTPVGRGLRAGGPPPCPRTRVRPLPAAGLPGVARSLPTRVSGGGRGRPPQQTPGRGGRKGRRVGVPASPRPPRFTSVRRERDRESVILPVHNAEPWLDECLRSVLQQDFQGSMELSVFNDASQDRSAAVIERWKGRLEDAGIPVVIGGHDAPAPRGGE
ncbi:uncharacterized protein LOC132009160, partial [Mustela nigripes]|uniref:uncharacterized protein LOC132009160 n=1 Tax=Mustela nigripes TaxID=77151 RepID=UPI002815CF6D